MNFTPYPGRITAWRQPEAAGVRVDTHCYSGYFVPPYYDSLLAKLVTWGDDRKAAIERMQKALADFVVSGVETTIPFHRFILESPGFRNGDVNTRWLEDRLLKEYERNERN
jgi:acetyl-CoA carboxylase biotin carboxylase subunit